MKLTKKEDREAEITAEELKTQELHTQLAKDLIWALNFLDTRRGGLRGSLSGISKVWQETFMDSLSRLGVEIDREKYWKMKKK